MIAIFKLMHLLGLLGILAQLLYQIGLFLYDSFMQVLSPLEQAQMQIEAVFIVFFTPLFWILLTISLIGYLGTRKLKNNLQL